MFMQVVKRDGRIVTFERQKIEFVIQKTLHETNKLDLLEAEAKEMFERDEKQLIRVLTDQVVAMVRQKNEYTIEIEMVQDIVEEVLKNCGEKVSERFHEVRLERSEARHRNTHLFKTIENITKATDRENANVGHGPSPKLLQIAEAATRIQAEMQLPAHIKKAFDNKELYGHDFAWAPVGTTTCTHIPLRKLLKDGFYIEGKFTREPKRIMSAAELACIILQSNQNDQHGGQAFGWFDRDLAPYVEKEYEYQLEEARFDAEEDGVELSEEHLAKKAWRKTVKETKRAMKGVIYNLNTMHARAGQMWAV